MSLSVSAPAKVILFGEHAVVYGQPAIAVAVDLRCYFDVTAKHHVNNTGSLCIYLRDLSETVVRLSKPADEYLGALLTSSEELLEKAWAMVSNTLYNSNPSIPKSTISRSVCICFYLLLRSLQIARSCTFPSSRAVLRCDLHTHIEVHSDIPVGAGLGSSAAFSVAAATTFLILSGCLSMESDFTPDRQQCDLIQSLAHEAEAIIHGKPSGLDTAVSVHGGGVYFKRHTSTPVLHRIPIPSEDWNILIVNSNVGRSTGEVVQAVADRRRRQTTAVDDLLQKIGDLSRKAFDVFNGSEVCLAKLTPLIRKNQQLLVNLDVSCLAVDEIISELCRFGLTAKLTGAGRGGCVIAVALNSCGYEQALQLMQNKSLWAKVVRGFAVGVHVLRTFPRPSAS
ncbi:Mevalonate kinase [Paragonimus heterotremus]|uniref:Mevalonate kinase n=1 Tax=Paragonimus heterotremus TaxID=100268 RepID=A0A8J4SVU5_9TREM|nr:Mevalonate kinase [Paragonimus heterotremus]